VLLGKSEEVVVVRIAAHGWNMSRVIGVATTGDDVRDEPLTMLLSDETGDLRPFHHVDELADELRAEEILESAGDSRGDDTARRPTGRDEGGHEDARVENDEHYEALRRSSLEARSSS
jgi:hypothetical protein